MNITINILSVERVTPFCTDISYIQSFWITFKSSTFSNLKKPTNCDKKLTSSFPSSFEFGSSLLWRWERLNDDDVVGTCVAIEGLLNTAPGRGTIQSSESDFILPEEKFCGSPFWGMSAMQPSHVFSAIGLNFDSNRWITELRRQSRLTIVLTRGLLKAKRLTRKKSAIRKKKYLLIRYCLRMNKSQFNYNN